VIVEDSIVRETLVAAPPERVWEVLTRPEYLPRWFTADTAEIDLRPGGALVMVWAEHGTGHARVERVEEPTLFSFRWALEPGVEPAPGEETLVEFTLTPEGDGTRLRVVESGFDKLEGTDDQRREAFEGNTEGWEVQLGNVRDYAARIAA
jgi:uncharacterized protein YndB with AHSA1/START domain